MGTAYLDPIPTCGFWRDQGTVTKNGGTLTITFPSINGYCGLMYICGNSGNVYGFYGLYSSTSQIKFSSFYPAPNVNVSVSSGSHNLTITNNDPNMSARVFVCTIYPEQSVI